jgi:hypothetical protein
MPCEYGYVMLELTSLKRNYPSTFYVVIDVID